MRMGGSSKVRGCRKHTAGSHELQGARVRASAAKCGEASNEWNNPDFPAREGHPVSVLIAPVCEAEDHRRVPKIPEEETGRGD
jgi:hypothetical protein